ncbi:hypothetical protein [Thiomonas sp.]
MTRADDTRGWQGLGAGLGVPFLPLGGPPAWKQAMIRAADQAAAEDAH